MIITEIQYFFSKIIRFQAIFKDTVEFTCALEFKISSQPCFAGYSFTNEPFTNHASMLALLRSLHYILRGAGFANGIWKYKTVGKCSWI